MSNKKTILLAVALLLTLFSAACAKKIDRAKVGVAHKSSSAHFSEEGLASWYGYHWSGRKTASGERFDPKKLTAAHRTLPFGTIVRVINLANDRSCEVRINDRGPSKRSKRLIDLSREAAKRLGFLGKGVTKVKIEQIN